MGGWCSPEAGLHSRYVENTGEWRDNRGAENLFLYIDVDTRSMYHGTRCGDQTCG